jgi:hypothetical protein
MQCACADFGDFAKQCNGGGGREKDLYMDMVIIIQNNFQD